MVLTIVVAIAGCAGLAADDPSDGMTPTLTDTPTVTETPTPTVTESPTPTPEPVDPDNPYGSQTLEVYLQDASSNEIDRHEELNETFEYWEENGEEYLGYPVEFEYSDFKDQANIVVSLKDGIRNCGSGLSPHDSNTLGCSPVVTESSHTDDVAVQIDNSYTSNDTKELLKHEFGHALGLDHDDEPVDVMDSHQVVTPLEETLRYSVSIDSEYDETEVREQIDGAIGFINDGSNKTMITDLELKEVDDRSTSFIHISVSADRDACDGNVTCIEDNYECSQDLRCVKLDDDGELNDTPYVVTSSSVATDYVGYAVAFELHRIFYRHAYLTEFPYELDNKSVDKGSQWWK